jgi:hypothetical protein
MTSKKELYKMGILSLVEREGGETKILEQIKERQRLGHLTSKQAHDLRQAIKKVCQEKDAIIEDMSKFLCLKD